MNNKLKIKCVSPKIKLGDVNYNSQLISNEIYNADNEGADIVLFPELCLCGYSLKDMLGSCALVGICQREILRIARDTRGTKALAVVGFPFSYKKQIYNSVAVIEGGDLLGVVPKSKFPMRSPYGENRVFKIPYVDDDQIEALATCLDFGTDLIFDVGDYGLGVVIGDARENAGNLAGMGADIILNPTADIVTVTMEDDRRQEAKEISYYNECVFVMCNSAETESSADGLFTPHSILCQNGKIIHEKNVFSEEIGDPVWEFDVKSTEKCKVISHDKSAKNSPHPFILDSAHEMDKRCELILNIQAHALARRLESTYSKKMVVGISGGLDSTLALIAMVKAADLLGWDRQNVVAITMPCFGTTKRTKSNATELCRELGVTIKEIDILEATRVHLRDIGHDESNHNVAYENAQARERTQILMDIANDIGGIVIGTGDLSEVALGWSTYNGDQMSMFNVNNDIPKTLVRCVVDYFARNTEESVAKILLDILDTPVSPELLPPCKSGEIEQKTEDLVGPYELHDYFLYNFVGRDMPPSKIYKNAKEAFEGKYDDGTIYKWLTIFIKRFITQQFKRSASPEGVKIGSVSLGSRGDFNMPSDMSYQVFLDELEMAK